MMHLRLHVSHFNLTLKYSIMLSQEQAIINQSAIFDAPRKSRFSEKYRKGLRGVAVYSVAEIRKTQPEWTLVQALAEILKDTNTDMPPTFVEEFIQHIVASWSLYEDTEHKSSAFVVA
jgi:hypothetical protein